MTRRGSKIQFLYFTNCDSLVSFIRSTFFDTKLLNIFQIIVTIYIIQNNII